MWWQFFRLNMFVFVEFISHRNRIRIIQNYCKWFHDSIDFRLHHIAAYIYMFVNKSTTAKSRNLKSKSNENKMNNSSYTSMYAEFLRSAVASRYPPKLRENWYLFWKGKISFCFVYRIMMQLDHHNCLISKIFGLTFFKKRRKLNLQTFKSIFNRRLKKKIKILNKVKNWKNEKKRKYRTLEILSSSKRNQSGDVADGRMYA